MRVVSIAAAMVCRSLLVLGLALGAFSPMPASAQQTTAADSRPQTPKPPFPYAAVEVGFDSAPGVRLAGTLTLPPGSGPFPVAVLIHGSGQHDRDETIFGHKPFLVLADSLTRRGIAVLRYDKRGVGGSSGRPLSATVADYAQDAKGAVAFLRGRREIKAGRIGLIGHSEGATVAPMVAAEDPGIAFVVMMAGVGVPGDQALLAQNRAILKAAGGTDAQMDAAEQANRKVYDIVKSDAPDAEVVEKLNATLTSLGLSADRARASAAQISAPYFRWFFRYDPQPTLRKLRCPVLAIDGSKDVQVVARQNLPAIRTALKDDPDATVLELPGLNHLFQVADTGGPDEYGRIQETITPSVLKLIGDWVVERSKP